MEAAEASPVGAGAGQGLRLSSWLCCCKLPGFFSSRELARLVWDREEVGCRAAEATAGAAADASAAAGAEGKPALDCTAVPFHSAPFLSRNQISHSLSLCMQVQDVPGHG
jgi:hypothetical protein